MIYHVDFEDGVITYGTVYGTVYDTFIHERTETILKFSELRIRWAKYRVEFVLWF